MRTTKKSKKRPNRKIKLPLIVVIIGLVAVSILTLTVPRFEDYLYQILGITQPQAVPDASSNSPVGVHFIDVGQGDAVLLEDNGEYALIDAGPGASKDGLVTYLKTANVQKLKYLVMTHPHEDHIGGMQAVVEEFEVEMMLFPDFAKAPMPTTRVLENLQEALLAANIPAQTATAGKQYQLGSGTMNIIHDGVETEDNYNLLSLGILYESQGLRYLCTGDGEKANEKAMLESGIPLRANLFKAGHHGSSTSNTLAFLQAVQPDIVVVQCGIRNAYGHPHREVLASFTEVGATVFRTDENRHVVIRPDKSGNLTYGTASEPPQQAA